MAQMLMKVGDLLLADVICAHPRQLRLLLGRRAGRLDS